jgi:hypothetical protein
MQPLTSLYILGLSAAHKLRTSIKSAVAATIPEPPPAASPQVKAPPTEIGSPPAKAPPANLGPPPVKAAPAALGPHPSALPAAPSSVSQPAAAAASAASPVKAAVKKLDAGTAGRACHRCGQVLDRCRWVLARVWSSPGTAVGRSCSDVTRSGRKHGQAFARMHACTRARTHTE